MSRLVRLILVAAGGLLISACATTSGSAGESVLPFSEVQETEFVFENDPMVPNRGIFRVTTTEPMICAIVWGETEELGHFNNSLDMNGTGIIEHNVFLPEAESGVEYFYRVQGSTADGTLYQSELMTFTLPERGDMGSDEAPASIGPNLALGATVVEASSEFSPSWAASNAIDDDLATEWSTSGDGDHGFITIDLGSSREVAGIEYLTRSMADGTAITDTYTVIVDDGEPLGPFPAGSPSNRSITRLEMTGQVLRFEIDTSTGGNTGAIEIRVFGPTS